MKRRLTALGVLGFALASCIQSGCDTSRPGAGFLNTDPATVESDTKPSLRTDFQLPDRTGGDAALADSVPSSPGSTGNDAGTGGRGAGQKGGSPRPDDAGAAPSPAETAENPKDTPPKIEAANPSGAQGETKPSGNINTGTPRSPQ